MMAEIAVGGPGDLTKVALGVIALKMSESNRANPGN